MDSNQNTKTTDSFPLWDFELSLFTHNLSKSGLTKDFTSEEAEYFKDCLELQLNKVLNSGHYQDNETCKFLNLIVKVSVHFALSLSGDIEGKLKEFVAFLKELYEKNKDTVPKIVQILYTSFYVLQALFLKENWLGKSYLYHDADHRLKVEGEEKLRKMGMEDRIKKRVQDTFDYNSYFEQRMGHKLEGANLNNYTYKFIKGPDVIMNQSESLRQYLVVDGEEIFKRLSYMSLFVIIKQFLKAIEEISPIRLPTINLWKARINFLHNKILNEKLTSLQIDVLKQYGEFFVETEKLLETEQDIVATLKVEYGNVLLYYYKYERSLKAFQEAQAIRQLNVKFTGKLGYKTKYQTFETAQLIVDAQSEKKSDKKDEEEKGESDLPKPVELEEDSILLEKPRLVDLNMENLTKEMKVYDQIIVLSLIYHLQKTTPKDDLLQEQVSAYLRSIMDKAQNWLVYSMCLYVRSLNEFARTKTKERSLLQIQALIDQFNDKKPKAYERIKYYYSLYYPSYLELQRTMAEKYMEIGMVMSSSELFAKLDMLEDSVECLAMAGHGEKAKEIALVMIEKNPNPKILSIYGELTGDTAYLERSWELSNKKFARAKRSEARFYFNRNNFEKAIECYKDALQINTYHASSWFTLGCAYLKVEKYQDAVVAFGQVVSIDETQGDGWANMAAAFSVQGKKLEAFNALQQAVKHHENSWRIWQNLMMISLECRKFKAFLEAIDRLLKINQSSLINQQVLKKVNQVFLYHTDKCTLQDVVELTFFKKKIAALYTVMEDKLATQPYFWAEYQEFINLHRLYIDKTRELEEELTQRTDLQASYAEHLKKRLQERPSEVEIKEKIADLCMKECHSIMIVGWQENKKHCKLLEEAIEKLKEAYAKITDEKSQIQLKIFLDANVPKIKKTLYE